MKTARHSSVMPSANSRGLRHKLEHRRPPTDFCAVCVTEHWHKLWSFEDLLGDLQKPTGHKPGQPALGVPAGARVGPDELQRTLLTPSMI